MNLYVETPGPWIGSSRDNCREDDKPFQGSVEPHLLLPTNVAACRFRAAEIVS